MGDYIKIVLLFFFLCASSSAIHASAYFFDQKSLNPNDSLVSGIEIPRHPSFNSVSSSSSSSSSSADCHLQSIMKTTPLASTEPKPVKLHLNHRWENHPDGKKKSVMDSSHRDLLRIQTLHRRIRDKKNKNTSTRLTTNQAQAQTPTPTPTPTSGITSENQLVATLESGVSLGSGEYFMDVFIGTPPKHFSLILDTGSDLNWIQCLPCHDCFEQNGSPYNPQESSSYRNVTCTDPICSLVSSPDPPHPCKLENQSCPYFYWYGDKSNTTGDFALETFTVNLTSAHGGGGSEFRKVDNVMFGCGHWNRGLFHGAAGLLGLGRGPLSFSSQLQSLYGHTFSYCLVDRNSNMSVSSKLILGEDQSLLKHPNLNYTSLVGGQENPADTFYYIQIKGIMVGGELLDIPEETWKLSGEGVGGTIIDSGTTLSYFAEPASDIIKKAFVKKTKAKGYPLIQDFPVLYPCYNVSGVDKVELPEFSILFGDGAVWNFPMENYFIRLDPDEIVCLAIMGTKPSSLSILGNYQQQNFHISYDTKKSRLGFAPVNCADIELLEMRPNTYVNTQ